MWGEAEVNSVGSCINNDMCKRRRGSASNQHELARVTQPHVRRSSWGRETIVSLLTVNSFSRRSDWAGVCDTFGARRHTDQCLHAVG
jgi:hypothetical protein